MLRLNPRLPFVWRTPNSCQFGSLTPVAILRDTTINQERAIAVLLEGTPRETLRALARQWQMPSTELDDLLSRISAALEPDAPHPTRLRVAIDGSGVGRDEIAQALRDEWIVDDSAPDVVVVVANYVLPLELTGRWLRRDVPHLIVVVDERGAHVGPLVIPGVTPCAHCVDAQARAADESWPAVATQLMFAPPPDLPVAVRFHIASDVEHVIRSWREGQERRDSCAGEIRGERIRVDLTRIEREVTPVTFSDDCQCRALQEIATECEPTRVIQMTTPTTS